MLIDEDDLKVGDNILDVTEWLRATPRTWRYKFSESAMETSMAWDLNSGWTRALDMSHTGWHAGVQKIVHGLQTLPMQERKKTYKHWDVTGDVGDIGRAFQGDPLCLSSRRKKRMPSLVTTIVLNMSANQSVTGTEFVNLGIAFASVINSLEQEGRRVELLIIHSSWVQTKYLAHGWWVKKANQPLDLDQLAFAVAHPASFRRIGFAMRERMDPTVQCEHYGSTANLPQTIIDRLGVPDDAVIMNAADLWHRHTQSPEAAIAAVSALVAKQGAKE